MRVTNRYLVVVDFPAIKSFVFGTDKLVEIRGGSGLLDQLNREDLTEFLQAELGTEHVQSIFVGGGSGQFIVTAEEQRIQEVFEKFKGICWRKSGGGLAMNFALQAYDGNYSQAKNLVYQTLRRQKEEYPLSLPANWHTGLIRECDSCSGYAEKFVEYAGENSLLCPVCANKTHFAQNSRLRLWEDFVQYAVGCGEDRQRILKAQPRTFQDVGNLCLSKPEHVGLIYADGNAMGYIVQQIDSPEDFEFFSKVVDQTIREACHEAMYELCLDRTLKTIPALILLLGGDDLLVYTTADRALPLALSVARKFEEKTKQILSNSHSDFFAQNLSQGLTVSLGISFGKAQTPFSLLLAQAEELLKSAKTQGCQDERCTSYYAPTYIDCHFTTQYNQIRVADSRREHLTQKTAQEQLELTSRPWDQETARMMWEEAGKLVHCGIPRSRLKRLGAAPALGKTLASLEFYTLLSRTRGHSNGRARKTLLWESLYRFGCRLDQAPWQQKNDDTLHTVLTDLVELSELFPRDLG